MHTYHLPPACAQVVGSSSSNQWRLQEKYKKGSYKSHTNNNGTNTTMSVTTTTTMLLDHHHHPSGVGVGVQHTHHGVQVVDKQSDVLVGVSTVQLETTAEGGGVHSGDGLGRREIEGELEDEVGVVACSGAAGDKSASSRAAAAWRICKRVVPLYVVAFSPTLHFSLFNTTYIRSTALR